MLSLTWVEGVSSVSSHGEVLRTEDLPLYSFSGPCDFNFFLFLLYIDFLIFVSLCKCVVVTFAVS